MEQLLWRLQQFYEPDMPAVILLHTLRIAEEENDVACVKEQGCEGACATKFRSVLELRRPTLVQTESMWVGER